MAGIPERLQLPPVLVEPARTELQRQEAFTKAAFLVWNIFFQTTDHKDIHDVGWMTIGRGATPPVPLEQDGRNLSLRIVNVIEYIHSPNKQYGWENMGGLSIQLADPSSEDKPAELARALFDGAGVRGFVRRTGFETYEVLDTKTGTLQGVAKLLEDYGQAVGYDPSIVESEKALVNQVDGSQANLDDRMRFLDEIA